MQLEEAIDLVVERIPDLEARGVPMTDSIPGKDWNVGIIETATGLDERGRRFQYAKEVRSSAPLYERVRPPKLEPQPMEPPPVKRVWDDWQVMTSWTSLQLSACFASWMIQHITWRNAAPSLTPREQPGEDHAA